MVQGMDRYAIDLYDRAYRIFNGIPDGSFPHLQPLARDLMVHFGF